MGRTGEIIGGAFLVAGLTAGCTEVVVPPAPTFAATGCEHFTPQFIQGVDPVRAIAQAILDCYKDGPSTVERSAAWDGTPPPLPNEDNVSVKVHEKDGGTVTFMATSPEPITSPTFADNVAKVEFGVQQGARNNILLNAAYYAKGWSGPTVDWYKMGPPPAMRFQVTKGIEGEKDSAMSVPLDSGGPKGELTYDERAVDCARQQAYGAFAELMKTAPDFTSGTPDVPLPLLHGNCGSNDQQ